MSFVEPVFALFLLVVLAVFLALPSLRLQLSWLLAASYLFYAWWDPRFLVLLLTSSAVDFLVGLAIPRARSAAGKKGLLVLSLAVNLGLLGTFKYAGFFTESLARAVERLGLTWDVPTVDLILPIGISFYTFQTLSYTIDVYRGKIEPCRSPLQFFFFVAAFPQLVAGPIVRARELLPQFHGDLR
ncbi:MAG: MBOAT family protein, partial [Thermoanaerobaculia bacterium]